MDRRDATSLWRDYGVPMQDPKAFSLQYGKDTSKDPSKGLVKKKSGKTKTFDLTDKTGLLKIRKSSLQPGKNVLQEGGLLFTQKPKEKFIDPEFVFKDTLNTKLTPEEYTKFKTWATTPSKNGRIPGTDVGAYDVQGYWKEFISKGDNPNDADDHGPDKYKKPNHPTFSTESMYVSKEYPGGTWDKDGAYNPPEKTKQWYSKEYYKRLFGREPHRPEHLGKYMEGGKLGLQGMGQMQGKAPQPTNHKAPADKVKQNFKLYKRKKK